MAIAVDAVIREAEMLGVHASLVEEGDCAVIVCSVVGRLAGDYENRNLAQVRKASWPSLLQPAGL